VLQSGSQVIFELQTYVLVCVVVVSSFAVWRMFKKAGEGKQIPYATWSFFETVAAMTSTESPMCIYDEIMKVGDTFQVWLPSFEQNVICTDWTVAKEVFNDSLSDKPSEYSAFEMGTGCPVLVSKKTSSPGPSGWAQQRKAFSSFFTKSNYDVRVLQRRLSELDILLDTAMIQSQGREGVVDATSLMVQFSIDVFGEAAFGVDMKGMSGAAPQEVSLARQFLKEVSVVHHELILKQWTAPWRRYMGFFLPEVREAFAARERLLSVGEAVIEQGRAQQQAPSEATPLKLMKTMLEFPFPTEKYRALETIMFLTGGYDTTGYTLAWTLYELAKNPEEQLALAKDLDEPDSVKKLPPRLHRVVNESMRLWPVIAGGGVRVASKDFKTKSGLVIKKGSSITFPLFSMFRSPWIRDANHFISDRWLDEDPQVADLRSGFVPFNAGRRNCIGQTHALLTIKASVAHLIKNFEWSLVQEPTPTYFLTNKPEGLRLRVKKRPLVE